MEYCNKKMAIYYPEMYCGVGSTLKVKKTFEIEFDDVTTQDFSLDDLCIVEDIVGYGFNIKAMNDSKIFRIKNGQMADYFELIELIPYTEKIPNNFNSFPLVIFKKKFKIDDVVCISVNDVFRHEISKTDKIFHNLYDMNSRRLVLRLNDDEFEKYLK